MTADLTWDLYPILHDSTNCIMTNSWWVTGITMAGERVEKIEWRSWHGNDAVFWHREA